MFNFGRQKLLLESGSHGPSGKPRLMRERKKDRTERRTDIIEYQTITDVTGMTSNTTEQTTTTNVRTIILTNVDMTSTQTWTGTHQVTVTIDGLTGEIASGVRYIYNHVYSTN